MAGIAPIAARHAIRNSRSLLRYWSNSNRLNALLKYKSRVGRV
jgi:hypothetical protein